MVDDEVEGLGGREHPPQEQVSVAELTPVFFARGFELPRHVRSLVGTTACD